MPISTSHFITAIINIFIDKINIIIYYLQEPVTICFHIDSGNVSTQGFAENGDLTPLLNEVSRQIKSIPSRGGFSGFNERALQLIFYFTLNNGGKGALDTRLECDDGDRGATDIFARNLKSGGRSLLLKLKYLPKAKGTDAAVAAKLEEAKAQLERYRKAPNFKDVHNLDCRAIVFVNAEPKAVEKLP